MAIDLMGKGRPGKGAGMMSPVGPGKGAGMMSPVGPGKGKKGGKNAMMTKRKMKSKR